MKKTGTMSETQEAIADFNHQLSIDIRVKKRIQELSAVVTSRTSQPTREEPMTADNSINEASAPLPKQAIGEETITVDDAQPPIEYYKDCEFDRFFQGAG